MPYRTLVFLWRNPALMPAEFQRYYDTQHLPLVRSLVGETRFPRRHTRWYTTTTAEGGAVLMRGSGLDVDESGKEDPLSYDVVAELEFDDEQHYRSFVSAAFAESEETRKTIQDDEARFLRRDKTTVLAVGDVSVMTTP